jgi:ERCC4-type nuclease
MDNSNNLICPNDYKTADALPLREYMIKACFNSSYDGTAISIDTLERRISEGYRFLDFNVVSASGDKLFVNFSQDNAPKTTDTSLSFDAVLESVSKYAFTQNPKYMTDATRSAGPSLQNNYVNYPMWLHIRVYRTPDSTVDIISLVAKAIRASQISTFLLKNPDSTPTQINGCTSLADIGKNKVLISMDIENVKQVYQSSDTLSAEWTPVETRKAMRSIVNVVTGGSTIPAFYKYADPTIVEKTVKLGTTDNTLMKTNVKYMYVVFPHPDDKLENPNFSTLLLNRSIQLIPMRASKSDDNLKKYTDIFDKLKTPYAPLTRVYSILTTGEPK